MGAALGPSGSKHRHHGLAARTQTLAFMAAVDLGDVAHPCCIYNVENGSPYLVGSWGSTGTSQHKRLAPGPAAGASGKSC